MLFEIYLISFHTSNDSKTPSHGDVDEMGKKLFNFDFLIFTTFEDENERRAREGGQTRIRTPWQE